MRKPFALLSAFALAAGAPLAAHDIPPPGIWTNTEDVYFAEEEGRTKGEWQALEIRADGAWRWIDAFAAPLGEWQTDAVPGLAPQDGGGWQLAGTELRQAREFRCWFSVRKFAGKPDGSEDWTFQRNLPIFDQGGRVFLPGNGEAPDVTIRMRNVTWAEGSTNNPVIVLYVHKADPVRAESYSWAAPDSAIVGVNLRWAQGGCNRDTKKPGPQEQAR